MDNEMLDNLEYIPDGGALMYQGIRYLLIRPETIIELQKVMETELGVEKLGYALYQAGYKGGSLSAEKFRTEQSLSPQEIVRFMATMGGQLGWGRMEVDQMNPDDGTFEMEVYHSVFAEAYGVANFPVCHLIRGVFAGTWGGAIDREIMGLETRCRAVEGPGPCKFIFTPSSRDSSLNVPFDPS
ncbi:hypothetical protein CEE37_13620 [candidate division LCP-89 bacterium B3_LCP]|uniref:4-vinyl reductase 4VR domain-containing protein n=1 Tax=candidate division LCP-89 bacterium B3_LCP TaxID=2012998 RepID=A0A532URH2_UNCL8|nr:MAG: hypothetical protein CEE37_13620 [candidate division LCP-89 bacterium B3_LCP]